MQKAFWQTKSLSAMGLEEWESLCDGCGLCCLHKLQDCDSGEITETGVACELLDCDSCRCGDYTNRHHVVLDCVRLTPENIGELSWLPESCAYRRVHFGEDLAWWHPLVSGSSESVHSAGISARGRCVSESEVGDDYWRSMEQKLGIKIVSE